MRRTLLFSLLAIFVVGSVFWYHSTAVICPAPLPYRIGTIDDSFDLDNETAREHVETAVSMWEDATGRDLFVYVETARLRVDFVFDERQEEANVEVVLRDQLDKKRDQNEAVMQMVEEMQGTHQELSQDYESRVNEYESRLAEYNQKVISYNDRGGAPADVFAELEEERVELNQIAEELTATSNQLNQLANDINELGERGNQMVEEYNEEVNEYNEKYGHAREFTQGDYQSEVINIYKFSNSGELVTVLAHEFGHALGIDHVDGPSSVMYYLFEEIDSGPRSLTEDDLAAYYEVCGTEESMSQRAHRFIRELI